MIMTDPSNPSYLPMFDCEKCSGLMKSGYFFGLLVLITVTTAISYLHILPFSLSLRSIYHVFIFLFLYSQNFRFFF